MNRTVPARLLHLTTAGLVASATALAWATPATAADTEKVDIAAQSWYRTRVNVCSAPIGCPPDPAPSAVSTFPKGTLHVALDAGQPAAHAYVKPDIESIPFGAKLLSGKLTLPVSEDPSSGNAAVETAKIVGCLVLDPITDGVEGGVTEPPAYDCEKAQAVAKPGKGAKTFTMDLAPFLNAWSTGLPPLGIALVPAPDQAADSSWQVMFNGKETEATPRASASVSFDEQTTSGGILPLPPPTSGDPAVVPGFSGAEMPSLGEPDIGAAPEVADSPAAETGPAPEPEVAPEQPVAAPHRLVNMHWYTHGGVVYLPLVFLAGIAIVARTLTRPVSPRPLRMTIGSR